MEAIPSGKSIDWDLSVKLASNKPDLAKELLDILINDLPATKQLINQAYAEQDYHSLALQVHKLHGATCYCGVPRLKMITEQLEIKLKKNPKQANNLIKQLNGEIDQVIAEFKKNNY